MIARRAGLVALLLAVSVLPAAADPFTISFTAGDVKEVMNDTYDDSLSDATYLWGLWSIRAMPIVSGGTYDIFSGAVDATASGDFWTYAAPSAGVTWASPYGSEVANFYLKPASEHLGTAAHPLYFIADQPATAFQSYAFDNTRDNGYGRSTYLGVCGVDVLATDPGCNQTNVLPDSALFSFSFDLSSGASLLGWQFLADGSKYYRAGSQPIGWGTSLWVEDFIGGGGRLPIDPFRQATEGAGLDYNVGPGYKVMTPVPEPATLSLVGLGLAGAAWARRRRR